jgi:hypothetical protein
MNKGLSTIIVITLAAGLLAGTAWAQNIYKTVDEDGNIIYSDQAPPDGSPPMELPEITIIETDYPNAEENLAKRVAGGDAAEGTDKPKSPRELRRLYRDFKILQPAPDETFWGSGNTVVVAWGSKTPFEPDMFVALFVNGNRQVAAPNGNVALSLDRGEHQVYAELRDGRNRRIVTTETVTFHVKQHSANFNRRAASPGGGN